MTYEMPPYRPPSEAGSVLIRATRNCPWNKCAFCPMYKGEKFGRREVDDILADIDKAHAFYGDKARRAFIGDADSTLLKTEDLVTILEHLCRAFPHLERVTSYARAATIARKPLEHFSALADAGLTRLHVGLESGDDEILLLMRKGATSEMMVEAGLKVKQAGISLCQYVLIGAGGEEMWLQHAQHTAAVLNRTDPDFIRVRTLVVAPGTPLDEMCERGEFQPASVMTLLREERELIATLDGIHSHFVSDHVSNLLPLMGELPDDKAGMLDIIDRTIEGIDSGGVTPRRVVVRL